MGGSVAKTLKTVFIIFLIAALFFLSSKMLSSMGSSYAESISYRVNIADREYLAPYFPVYQSEELALGIRQNPIYELGVRKLLEVFSREEGLSGLVVVGFDEDGEYFAVNLVRHYISRDTGGNRSLQAEIYRIVFHKIGDSELKFSLPVNQ